MSKRHNSADTPAFPHDHSTPISGREIEIDGKEYSYFDQLVWPGIATTPGLPATAAPIEISETGLPIGVQIVGPYLEDRTPIVFAELIEREFRRLRAASGLRLEPALSSGVREVPFTSKVLECGGTGTMPHWICRGISCELI